MVPKPTDLSRIAAYLALSMQSGALSIKSCNTLSRKRIISSIKLGLFFHSLKVSIFKDDKQQTAVRSSPKWSIPVGRVISLQRLEVLTDKPASLWCSGIIRFTWSEKIIYGSPVSIRAFNSLIQSERAETFRTGDWSLGLIRPHSSSFSTARMKASGTNTPWWRFGALRLGSPPVGRRISMNSSISGWDIGR